MNWYIQILNTFAEFNSNTRRSEYWYLVLIYIVVFFSIYLFDADISLLCKLHIGYLAVFVISILSIYVMTLEDIYRSNSCFGVYFPIDMISDFFSLIKVLFGKMNLDNN